jgi:phosphopantothenoylcysteine synthetase/decarboxylase
VSDVLVTLVVCGTPLASRSAEVVAELSAQDWRVTVVGTPSAAAWLDMDAIARLTGEPPRLGFRRQPKAKTNGQPSAVVVCPATFNTINKAVYGANDTYALGVLGEALGTGVPLVVVPMVNDRLWGHPSWSDNLGLLRKAGAVLVDVVGGGIVPTPVVSGTDDRVVANFDPGWLIGYVARILER